MAFWSAICGFTFLEITGADTVQTIFRINQANVPIYRMQWMDDLTVRFSCRTQDRKIVQHICSKQGDAVRILGQQGGYAICQWVKNRLAMMTGIVVFMILTMFLPTRILFFSVEGNDLIPDRQILEAAEQCGIRFGVSRRALRSEKMKNALLESLPGLKWAGINTTGCTAVISVREQGLQQEEPMAFTYSDVVAVRDGYITDCTVTRGTGLCSPGQIVREGQILISGYTDCGICVHVTEAEGEVFAQTRHELDAVALSQCLKQVQMEHIERNVSLILGKKRINLWKDSGISDTTCDRMYEEYYITLPGGFTLPARLCVETQTTWLTQTTHISTEMIPDNLQEFAKRMVLEQMAAGKILHAEDELITLPDCYRLYSRFLCEEMIGRVITEEIGDFNGKAD